MKTVVIYVEACEMPAYYLAEGDLRRFEKISINTAYESDDPRRKLETELCELIYTSVGTKQGFLLNPLTTEQAIEEIKHGAFLVICGELP